MTEERGVDAEELFVGFVAAVEAGDAPDLGELCRAHPAQSDALKQLHADWQRVAKALERVRPSLEDESPTKLAELSRLVDDVASDGPVEAAFSSEVVSRLSKRAHAFDRYERGELLGCGAMGEVFGVFDGDLRRRLAMKTIRGSHRTIAMGVIRTPNPRAVGRFLEEAQITAQLDHPGIVPVHELGLDDQGRLYFTMKLVRGDTLERVIARCHDGDRDWPVPRVLAVVQRVCEAMAYAHEKGVVHRDLKPGNIMVGRFGEVYVMDWGLAHVIGSAGGADVRIRPLEAAESIDITSERKERKQRDPDSPLVTMDGDVVGTPAYMPPEQALGHLDHIDRRSDVYSVGSILYHLLAGEMPYASSSGAHPGNHEIWTLVREGPPTPLAKLAPETPVELVAICEKAMARERLGRYADIGDLGDDLRAYLEGRVVGAHASGPWVELRKWVGRNRGLAGTLAALVAVVASAGFAVAWQQGRVADSERARYSAETLRVEEGLERVGTGLVAEAEHSWPIHPSSVVAMDEWLQDARGFAASLEPYLVELARVRATHGVEVRPEVDATSPPPGSRLAHLVNSRGDWIRGLSDAEDVLLQDAPDPRQAERAERTMEVLPAMIAYLDRDIADELEGLSRSTWRLDDPARAPRFAWLERLERTHERLADPRRGLIAAVESSRALASTLESRTTADAADAWREAIRSIGDPAECPHYAGLEIRPQLGLVPLHRDPGSGLWEFLHVLSGSAPDLARDRMRMGRESGIVLVLLPGGRFSMGAPGPGAPDADPFAPSFERPAHDVHLAPFFLSKFELTQAQWMRATGRNPSFFTVGVELKGELRIGPTHPVEMVTLDTCMQALDKWGLVVPTEAQWEYGARAGTTSPHWWGPSFEAGLGRVNFFDQAAAATGFGAAPESYLDGYAVHAPVDTFVPNPFGLYHVLGNVGELCRDWYVDDYKDVLHEGGDGLIVAPYRVSEVVRGGSYRGRPGFLRCSYRERNPLGNPADDVGIRPARTLDR